MWLANLYWLHWLLGGDVEVTEDRQAQKSWRLFSINYWHVLWSGLEESDYLRSAEWEHCLTFFKQRDYSAPSIHPWSLEKAPNPLYPHCAPVKGDRENALDHLQEKAKGKWKWQPCSLNMQSNSVGVEFIWIDMMQCRHLLQLHLASLLHEWFLLVRAKNMLQKPLLWSSGDLRLQYARVTCWGNILTYLKCFDEEKRILECCHCCLHGCHLHPE